MNATTSILANIATVLHDDGCNYHTFTAQVGSVWTAPNGDTVRIAGAGLRYIPWTGAGYASASYSLDGRSWLARSGMAAARRQA